MESLPEQREGDDDVEAKMEQFFAIVQRYREACAKLRRREEAEEGGCTAKRRKVVAAGTSWVPKFEREDFKIAAEPTAANTGSGEFCGISSKRGEMKSVMMKEEDCDDGKLELKLCL